MIIKSNPIPLCSYHAAQRVEERYDMSADPILNNGLLSKIRSGCCKTLRSLPDKTTYRVRYRRRSFTLVVNKSIDVIITFLPPGSTG
jgi:hypothetical protein